MSDNEEVKTDEGAAVDLEQPTETPFPVITVNGEEVLERLVLEEEDALLRRMRAGGVEQTDADHVRRDAIDNAIERLLLQQKARDIKVSKKEVDAELNRMMRQHGGLKQFYERYGLSKADEPMMKAGIQTEMQVQRYLERICENVPKPTEEEIEAYYNENAKAFVEPEAVRARHILIQPGQGAPAAVAMTNMLNLRRDLESGKVDFAETAGRISHDQGTRETGGDLGWVPRGQMVPPFEEALFALKAGELSDVVQTQYGLHLIQATEWREASPIPLEKVSKYIEKRLEDAAKNVVIGEHVDLLLQTAIVEKPEPDDGEPTEGTEPDEGADATAGAASEASEEE